MKKRNLILLLLLSMTLPVIRGHAQSGRDPEKVKRELLSALNRVIRKSGVQHWAYEGPVKIVQPFTIDKDGRLSVTTRYTTEKGDFLVKMETPLSEIRRADLDIYLILLTGPDQVNVYESEPGSTQLKLVNRRNLLHIGLADEEQLEATRSLLKKVLLRYADSITEYSIGLPGS